MQIQVFIRVHWRLFAVLLVRLYPTDIDFDDSKWWCSPRSVGFLVKCGQQKEAKAEMKRVLEEIQAASLLAIGSQKTEPSQFHKVAWRISELVSRLIRNQLLRKELRVRIPRFVSSAFTRTPPEAVFLLATRLVPKLAYNLDHLNRAKRIAEVVKAFGTPHKPKVLTTSATAFQSKPRFKYDRYS